MEKNKTKKKGGCLLGCLSFTMVCLGVLALASLWLFPPTQVLTNLGKFIIHADPMEKVDAIVVLSGGGLPRLKEAAEIYKENKGGFVVLTETGIITDKYGDLSQIEKTQLTEMGVQSRYILITETHVDTTTDEALVVRRLVSKNGFKSIIVVTDTFHTMRTYMIFQDTFKGRDTKIVVRPVRDDWYTAATWWKSLHGWQVTIQEYSKLIGYFFEQRFLK